MEIPKIVQELLDKKAEMSNTIDLDAYANGLLDMYQALQLHKTQVIDSFFRKDDKLNIIFYNGENKQEVLDFFKDNNYGKFLKIESNNLYYEVKSYNKKLIKENVYIYFDYDEDDWWCINQITEERFNKDFVSVKL